MEEEYLLVGPDGFPAAVASAVLEGAGALDAELTEQQLEIGTPVCATIADVAHEVRAGRARASAAANQAGAGVAALATSPLPVTATVMPDPRYQAMREMFAVTAREQLTCGCHVHVSVDDEDEGIAALDRIGVWLPVLLAISSNSPFWRGEDTGFSSFRSQVWNRWPTAGPTPPFGTSTHYRGLVEDLVATGTVLDAGMVYFDARLSHKYPTVEVRIADVCLEADDAVLLAALARALVETAAREAASGLSPDTPRAEILRAATWRAGRSGLRDTLVSPVSGRPVAARAAVRELIEHVAPALADADDSATVDVLLGRLWDRGTGSHAQRQVIARGGGLPQLVAHAVERTLA